MKALCWYGKNDVRVQEVPDPKILNPRDAIVKITSTAICGSDLHLLDGYIPTMREGDILGHEFMGEVVEVGPGVRNLRPGDRVVVPFTIACGNCFFCRQELWSLCDNSNPNAWMVESLIGYTPSGLFGYSHLFGGYAGGQAQYARVPFADVGPMVVPDGLSDDQVLFLTDVLSTGYMAAENCNIQPGDTVAVWGCGAVGQFAIVSAYLLGAERVIAIDRVPERLRMAEVHGHADTIDYELNPDTVEKLKQMTGGRGPDACIDAVGMEAHGTGAQFAYDRVKQVLHLHSDRGSALREAAIAVRKGGVLSVMGIYGVIDKFPFGVLTNKGITLRTTQQPGQRYMTRMLEHVQAGELDPSFLLTHRMSLEDGPRGYELFKDKQDGCLRAAFAP